MLFFVVCFWWWCFLFKHLTPSYTCTGDDRPTPCKAISGVVTQALAEETTVCSCARRRISRCCSLRHPLPLTPSSEVAAGVKERAWEQASDPSISKQSFIIMQRLDLAAEDLEIREAQCELNQIIITRVSKILTL